MALINGDGSPFLMKDTVWHRRIGVNGKRNVIVIFSSFRILVNPEVFLHASSKFLKEIKSMRSQNAKGHLPREWQQQQLPLLI